MKTYLLHRKLKSKYILGVCSGLSESIYINLFIIRIIFLVLLFFGGFGLIIYLLFYLSMAKSPKDSSYNKSKILGVIKFLSDRTETDLSILRVFSIFLFIISGIIPFLVVYLLIYFAIIFTGSHYLKK